jgi:hypothetical protein
MKAHELIEKLKTLDPNANIMVLGYEGGYNDVKTLEEIEVVLNHHEEWYYGKHELAEYVRKKENKEIVKGIVLK